jgi:hypothetical protein
MPGRFVLQNISRSASRALVRLTMDELGGDTERNT